MAVNLHKGKARSIPERAFLFAGKTAEEAAAAEDSWEKALADEYENENEDERAVAQFRRKVYRHWKCE